MKSPFVRLWALALFALALASCGGNDGGDGGGTTPPPPSASIKDKINAAAADPANDSSTNSSSAFAVLQNAGVPAVVVNSPPKVNFTVFSNGAVLKTLTTSNVSFIIAKLVPGTDGNPDKWESYTYRVETAAPGVGPGGNPVLESAVQATTDSKTATQLVYKDDGYYTYTFSKDITDPTQTNGVVFEPGRTHRIAIQLSYPNPNDDPNISGDETVRVNPYFDVTFDSNGNSVAVTDPSKTRKVTDVSSCNGCHEKLALHGGGRVDTQYCVMCHNPGTTDANSGNVLTLSTMAHKIHAGRLIANAAGGEHYVIWGYQNSKHDYAEVGFPQDLRNCTKCHSADNPNTPQGDLWKSAVSKEACLTCHANNAGSAWDDTHKIYAGSSSGKDLTNAQCKQCHITGGNLGPDVVHWNQNEENAAKYKMVIESAAYDAASRNVTVKYYLADPTNSNAKYNLLTTGCTGSGTSASCPNTEKFANLRFYVAYQALVGQPTAVTEFSSYNNGGSGANAVRVQGHERRFQQLHGRDHAAGRHRDLGRGRYREGRHHRADQGAVAGGQVGGESAARGRAAGADQHAGTEHLQGCRADRNDESAPRDRQQREVQRVSRCAGRHLGFQHPGQRLPQWSAQYGRGLRAVPRREPFVVYRDDQRAPVAGVVSVQTDDPRNPRQLEANLSVPARQQGLGRMEQGRDPADRRPQHAQYSAHPGSCWVDVA